MHDALLIANRGEIACRVLRTAHRLGIRTVAVFEAADAGAPHVAGADAAVGIGSYLDVEAIVAAAVAAGADALHPGYGFLSERPALARACAEAGVTWVGPSADVIELLGDKVRATAAAEAAGVAVVPGSALHAVDAYPVIVKAAAGGGGRGMRVVRAPDELEAAVAAARREARAAFGSDAVFLERYVARARHVEVQVLGDAHGAVLHLGVRDCSLQRRHQKVIEEAPSLVPTALAEEAVALARSVGYVNAGTVEFLVDTETGEHFFLEMNTRLQVEHPVTELVTRLDLVELQLRVAAGEPLPLSQDDVVLRGHAVEARVTAEDPVTGLPAAGRVLAYRRPAGVRVDDWIGPGTTVGTAYDSLLAKVVVHAADRPAALARLDRALAGTAVLGVPTNLGRLRGLLALEDMRADRLDTGLVERAPAPEPPADAAVVARAAAGVRLRLAAGAAGDDPFERTDGWRLGGARGRSWWRFAVDGGEAIEVELEATPPEVEASSGGRDHTNSTPGLGAAGVPGASTGELRVDGRPWSFAVDGDDVWLGTEGWAWRAHEPTAEEAAGAGAGGDLRAPMPGQVLLVHAAAGDVVAAGQPIVVLESMKMELSLTAPADGVVAEVGVAVGDRVALDQVVARMEASAGEAGHADERSEAT